MNEHKPKFYGRPDINDDRVRALQIAHLDAMTREGLHLKSDIAWELAWRDDQIDYWKEVASNLNNIIVNRAKG